MSLMPLRAKRVSSNSEMPAEVFLESREELLRNRIKIVAPTQNQREIVVAAVPDLDSVGFRGSISFVAIPLFDSIGVDETEVCAGSTLEGSDRLARFGRCLAPHDDEVIAMFHGVLLLRLHCASKSSFSVVALAPLSCRAELIP